MEIVEVDALVRPAARESHDDIVDDWHVQGHGRLKPPQIGVRRRPGIEVRMTEFVIGLTCARFRSAEANQQIGIARLPAERCRVGEPELHAGKFHRRNGFGANN
jgi:hypothetical protein